MSPWQPDPPSVRKVPGLLRHIDDDWVCRTRDLLCNLSATVALSADLTIQYYGMCALLHHHNNHEMIKGQLDVILVPHTCIAWYTEECPNGDENGVGQHHTHMDQDVEN